MIDPVLHGDRPIQSEREDRFGFTALADRIAEALTMQAANKGYVFGLEGKWGSGKSSLLGLTLMKLRSEDPSKVAAVEFRPWLIGDRDQLLTALFEDLAKAIAGLQHASGDATGTTALAASDVVNQVRKFARHLGPVGKLSGVLGTFVPGATLAGDILEKIASAAAEDVDGPTLVAQKEKLAKSLLELNCRIIVAIDDVDRLEPKEVSELLRLVRSVADFPNVSYLLCYDGVALSRSIETGTGVANGTAYLEKIVQTEVAVPRPEAFALRRWFTDELQTFVECPEERIPYLQQVIDRTGGRVLQNPRAVIRVLDSLRVYWPSLAGRVDVADLVWLRMIAVGSPNLYRWIEEYSGTSVALASGRVHITDETRDSVAREMDAALTSDGLKWDELHFEFDEHLPGIQTLSYNENKDERLFAQTDPLIRVRASRDQRLASPSHARLYFTLIAPLDGVSEFDIADLLAAERDGAKAIAAMVVKMDQQKGDAGASKAERLLDQMRHVDQEVIVGWPIEKLVLGLANSADDLAINANSDDWGYPRVWYLLTALLRQVRGAIPERRFEAALTAMFAESSSLGFLSYLLRGETFGHGFFGDRPDPHNRLCSREGFEANRLVMLQRYKAGGVDRVMEERHATTMLYAWSQAGGRGELADQVAARASNDQWLLAFLKKLYGPRSTLSPDGIASFFEAPAAIVRRVYDMHEADPENEMAAEIIRSIKSNLQFSNGDFETRLFEWESREASSEHLSEEAIGSPLQVTHDDDNP
ncbi:NTPase KAP [Rhizobium laguerreae]|uniref:KAP family P-loop NTPase fold protein n=1 Tax=Rhizobium laguerreae TaxID=1076926 RepID=UPI001C90C256|nr:P-loop NTPase fold protein [Rhizobium laguerreae]MBY3238695.1 NTPase KAP [Rhizobium laguerreae]